MTTYEDVDFYTSADEIIYEEAYFRIIRISTINVTIGIKKDGFAHRVYTACNLGRLDNIHQYGWLEKTPHTRMNHLFLTYAFTHYIMAGNQIIGEESLVTLYFAALTHDVTTPAFGDRVKPIAPKDLDEEKTYARWIKRTNVQKFMQIYGINPEECKKAVEGKNKIGRIIDWADKIAYTYFDIAQIKERKPNIFNAFIQKVSLYRQSFKSPLIYELTPGTILEKGYSLHTTLHNTHSDEIGSNDSQIFVCFVIIRAALLETACFTSRTNAVYSFYGYIIIPHLIKHDILTIPSLLEKTDEELARIIRAFFETDELVVNPDYCSGQWWFNTEHEARNKVALEMEKPNTIAWYQTSIQYGDICTSAVFKLNIYHNGIVEPIRDVGLCIPFIRKSEEYHRKRFHVISITDLPYKETILIGVKDAIKK